MRNPYDRAYSGFRQLQKDIQEQHSASFPEPWIRDLVRQQLAENFTQLCRAGFQFDDWIALVRDEQVYDIGRNSNFPLHPAHYWSHIGGVRAVDFIGQVETFEADFRRFLSEVGIQESEEVNENVVDLVGASASDPSGYRYVARMNERSKARINELFVRDFELFGYEKCS